MRKYPAICKRFADWLILSRQVKWNYLDCLVVEAVVALVVIHLFFVNSVAFGMRKALQAEQGKADMERKVQRIKRREKYQALQSWTYYHIIGLGSGYSHIF
jgi:hypothetical protein